MSARMQFPLSQRRHTNIAVVRYAKNGVKLEIACYKNKVISYRSGTENRMDEVLQVERVFTNVARGYLASEKEIQAVFGDDMTEQEAIKYMLEHGELQVAQQERTAEVDEMFKDIAVIISQKCVNIKTQHPFPSQVIEQALRSVGAAVKLDQPVKKQALNLIHTLIESNIIPIARANMKIRCTAPTEAALEQLRAWCAENNAEVVERDPAAAAAASNAGGGASSSSHSLLLLMQPNLFRDLDRYVKEELPSGSTIHMVDAAVTEVDDADVLLDPNAVSRANAQPGSAEEASGAAARKAVAGGGAPSSSSAGKAHHGARARGGGNTGASSSSVDRDINSSSAGQPQTSEADSRQGHGGGGVSKAAAARGKRRGQASGGDSDEDGDIATQLQKLGLDPSQGPQDDSDDDEGGRGGARGGGKAKNKKKAAAAAAGAPAAGGKKAAGAAAAAHPGGDADDDSDDDRKGKKGKKGAKNKKAAAAPVAEKAEPEAEEAFSDSDEELMGNRKQRAKKQQEAQTQQGGNDWDEDFDYGEDEEDENATN